MPCSAGRGSIFIHVLCELASCMEEDLDKDTTPLPSHPAPPWSLSRRSDVGSYLIGALSPHNHTACQSHIPELLWDQSGAVFGGTRSCWWDSRYISEVFHALERPSDPLLILSWEDSKQNLSSWLFQTRSTSSSLVEDHAGGSSVHWYWCS